MESGAIKWHVHCSVCGAFIEKSAQSDSEVECKKCRSTLEIVVKDDIVSVDVIDYNDPSWPQLMTWKEGKLGNTGTQEMLFCTNPMITFKAGTKTGVDLK